MTENGKACDVCTYFDEESNWCMIHDKPTVDNNHCADFEEKK